MKIVKLQKVSKIVIKKDIKHEDYKKNTVQ